MEMNRYPYDWKRIQHGDDGALNNGRFGNFGGMFVPETLIPACQELEKAFRKHGVQKPFGTS